MIHYRNYFQMLTIITNYVFILIQFEDTNATGDNNSTTAMITTLMPAEL